MRRVALALLVLTPLTAAQLGDGTAPSVSRYPGGTFEAVSSNGGAATGRVGVTAFTGTNRWFGGPTFEVLAGDTLGGRAISANGLVVLAQAPSPTAPLASLAARWFPIGGWTTLPAPAGVPTADLSMIGAAMSDDGDTIVGFTSLPGNDVDPFRWRSGLGSEALPLPVLSTRGAAYSVSRDGQVVGGSVSFFNPLTFETTFQPCLWTAGDVIELPLPPADTGSPFLSDGAAAIVDLDDDGDAALGVDADGAPFVWRAGQGVTFLPGTTDGTITPSDMEPIALGVDATFVLGRTTFGGDDHWLWTPQGGTLPFGQVLDAFDLTAALSDVTSFRLEDATLDGMRIAGSTVKMPGFVVTERDALLIDIPSPSTYGGWTDLGGALGDPAPTLRGEGLLLAGTPTALRLESTQPSFGSLVVGFSDVSAPFKGGVLVPKPDVLVNITSLSGGWTLPFTWPDGIPAGTSIWYQAWLSDSAGPNGFVSTNAVRSTTM